MFLYATYVYMDCCAIIVMCTVVIITLFDPYTPVSCLCHFLHFVTLTRFLFLLCVFCILIPTLHCIFLCFFVVVPSFLKTVIV